MENIEYYNLIKNLICCCAFDIQQFFLFRDIAGDPLSRGISLRYWFIYISAGKGDATINGIEYSLYRGSLIILHPGVEFCISPKNGETLSYYAIGFTFKNAFCSEKQDNIFNNAKGQIILSNHVKIENLLDDMHRFSLNGNINSNPDMKCAFYNLMASFLEDIKSGLYNMAIYNRIEKTTEYIYKNYTGNIYIGELARMCNISKEYYIRAFKKYTGLPPGRFIINIRINKAKEMLLTGTCSVREVASLVGFKDEMYFSKLFKKIVGIPPGYYKTGSIYDFAARSHFQ